MYILFMHVSLVNTGNCPCRFGNKKTVHEEEKSVEISVCKKERRGKGSRIHLNLLEDAQQSMYTCLRERSFTGVAT